MLRFLKAIGWFLFFPALIVMITIVIYLITDPFKVIGHYSTFFDPNTAGTIGMNKSYVSTETYLDNYKTREYNSFILGNSRSCNYRIADWKTFLPKHTVAYHFDANNETLLGIHRSLKFLHEHQAEIKNVLMVVDASTLLVSRSRPGHLYIISPKLMDNENLIDFHWTHYKTFLSPPFMYAFLDYRLSGKVKPYMQENYLINGGKYAYDPLTNEVTYPYYDSLIRANQYYTPEIMSYFYKRDSIVKSSEQVIHESQKLLLEQIREILRIHKTNFKFVINPLYDQLSLNKNDLECLKSIFGNENVFDFSGINELTADYKNFYESSHYRPEVAAEVMRRVYGSTLNVQR